MIWGPRRPLFGLYSNPMHMFLFWSKFLQHKSNLEDSYREALKQFIGCVSFILFLKEINPEYLLERLMLGLKLQYFGYWMWRTDSFEEEKRTRGWDGWMASPAQWMYVWADSKRQWRTGKGAGMSQSMGLQRVKHAWATEQKQYFQMIIWTYQITISHWISCQWGMLPK